MRIAISGSAGTGKTTLAKALAERLGIHYIPEGYECLFDERGRYRTPPARIANLIEEILDKKHRLELSHGAFVADRCPVDLFNLWLNRGFAKHQDTTTRLFSKCLDNLRKYDCVVLLPWGALPLKQVDEPRSRRVRTMNRWVQFHNHATILGLARQCIPPSKILSVPPEVDALDERVEYIIAQRDFSQPRRLRSDCR